MREDRKKFVKHQQLYKVVYTDNVSHYAKSESSIVSGYTPHTHLERVEIREKCVRETRIGNEAQKRNSQVQKSDVLTLNLATRVAKKAPINSRQHRTPVLATKNA